MTLSLQIYNISFDYEHKITNIFLKSFEIWEIICNFAHTIKMKEHERNRKTDKGTQIPSA